MSIDAGIKNNNVMVDLRHEHEDSEMMEKCDRQGLRAQYVDHGALGKWAHCDLRVQPL